MAPMARSFAQPTGALSVRLTQLPLPEGSPLLPHYGGALLHRGQPPQMPDPEQKPFDRLQPHPWKNVQLAAPT